MDQLNTIQTTWFDRLVFNVFSYFIVLVPIAFVVITTKYKLCPSFFQSSILVQWFVFGIDTSYQNNKALNNQRKDQEELLLESINQKHEGKRQIQSKDNKPKPSKWSLLFCFLGLKICYIFWSYLQEKIMTTQYLVHQETLQDDTGIQFPTDIAQQHKSDQFITFPDSQFLVFINRIMAFIIATIALVINSKNRRPQSYQAKMQLSREKPSPPLYEYLYSSLSNILSSWCQYEALKYVNFPTQVMSKACKLVPVMLMSKLILRKKYQTFDYFCALGFSIGMTIFLISQPQVSHYQLSQEDDISKLRNSSMLCGLLILALYLAFDSFTSNWQQSLFTRYKTSEWQMMAAINFYSILFTLTSLYHLGNLAPSLKLLSRSRSLMTDCLLMSLTSAFGQLFVYYTIKKFGSVVFTLIMTFRQLVSVVVSYLIFKHEPTIGSFIGLIIVFGIAFIQIWRKAM